MHYYKVEKDGYVTGLLTEFRYIRYDKRHQLVVSCSPEYAEGFLSEDFTHYWRTPDMREGGGNFETVDVTEITEYEYNKLRILDMKTPQEIIDAYTMSLIDGGII